MLAILSHWPAIYFCVWRAHVCKFSYDSWLSCIVSVACETTGTCDRRGSQVYHQLLAKVRQMIVDHRDVDSRYEEIIQLAVELLADKGVAKTT